MNLMNLMNHYEPLGHPLRSGCPSRQGKGSRNRDRNANRLRERTNTKVGLDSRERLIDTSRCAKTSEKPRRLCRVLAARMVERGVTGWRCQPSSVAAYRKRASVCEMMPALPTRSSDRAMSSVGQVACAHRCCRPSRRRGADTQRATKLTRPGAGKRRCDRCHDRTATATSAPAGTQDLVWPAPSAAAVTYVAWHRVDR